MTAEFDRSQRFGRAEYVVRLGLFFNVILMVGKLLAGRFGRSDAVFADGIESACDMAISAATLVALRVSRRPLDSRHPYGHGRVESIAALIVGCAIIATGVWILYAAAGTVVNGHLHRPTLLAVAAAAITIVSKELLARFTFREGRSLSSPVLHALGQDHRKDAITSVATLVGCGAAALGWLILDPIVAGVTALLIARAGIETIRDAANDLMDSSLPHTTLDAIRAIATQVPGVDQVHDIRGRRSGQYMIIDLKLEMDPQMTVQRSHDISALVKRRIFDAHSDVGDVMIHINPCNDPGHEDLVRL